jgi:hypothetical protein
MSVTGEDAHRSLNARSQYRLWRVAATGTAAGCSNGSGGGSLEAATTKGRSNGSGGWKQRPRRVAATAVVAVGRSNG